MNRQELIQYVQKQTGYGAKDAKDTVNATLDGIAQALEDGDKVTLVGFGTFTVKDRAAKIGRNPHTGEPVTIPARRTITFKVAKNVKEALNSAEATTA